MISEFKAEIQQLYEKFIENFVKLSVRLFNGFDGCFDPYLFIFTRFKDTFKFKFQVRHQNENMKIFLRRLPLGSFLPKILRVHKIAMKKRLKNLSFGVDFEL